MEKPPVWLASAVRVSRMWQTSCQRITLPACTWGLPSDAAAIAAPAVYRTYVVFQQASVMFSHHLLLCVICRVIPSVENLNFKNSKICRFLWILKYQQFFFLNLLSRNGLLHCLCLSLLKPLDTTVPVSGASLLHAVNCEWFCFLAPSVCGFCLCMNYLGEPLNGFEPDSHGRRLWSLTQTSLKVKGQDHQGQKRYFFGSFGSLRAVYVW